MNEKILKYEDYLLILQNELIPAMGCSEPIAVALAAATAAKVLNEPVIEVEATVSNNILKNVKSATIPNTNGKKGIEAAVSVGIVAGIPEKMLEVISVVTESQNKRITQFLSDIPIHVTTSKSNNIFDIGVRVIGQSTDAYVHIIDHHTNIIEVKRGQQTINAREHLCGEEPPDLGKYLRVEDILDFVERVDIGDIEEIVQRQIVFNSAISNEGLKRHYGADIGRILIETYGDDVEILAKAKAAAGSDARMGGCEMPVVIVAGSGNQGITASVPVIEYAKKLGASREKLIRAVTLSDLITVRIKSGIGKLSAYCGAVSAGCAAGAAIAYLNGGDFEMIAHTLVNSLAIVSGIICDGAKPSCAAKIASAVDAGILGWQMYEQGTQFYSGEGIVVKGVEENLDNIGRLGRVGMRETDEEIIKMMLNTTCV